MKMSSEEKVYTEVAVIRRLAQRGLIERSAGGAVKVATAPMSSSVKLGRPFVVLCCHIRIFAGVPLKELKEVVRLHVGIEGFRINRARLNQLCLLFRGQKHRDFVRNRLGYFVFDIKNIFHRIVVIL